MLKQTFTQMPEISVGISLRCDPFVYLNDMHTLPRHIFVRQIAKHDPRGFTAADRHHERATSCDCRARFLRDKLGGFECDRISIGVDFNFHQAASLANASAFFSPRLLQPPFGATRATSSGPQVPAAY